jgi:UDP-2,3-diacylglucosamine pyrophosphatase LpxH
MSRHYVISDLHLGMGRINQTDWHPLEDFKSDDTFHRYLDFIENDGGDELIINGDWIDFMQLEPLAYDPDHLHYSEDGHILGWTQQDSLAKLESCTAQLAHKSFFDDLRHFLSSGKKLTIIMGNHDPDLFWPEVKSKIISYLNPPQADRLEFSQTFVRRGTAHIEHGNQYCSPENKFYNPENVFHRSTEDNLDRLEMAWGTIFVMEFFNSIEEEFPFADNVKTQARAIWLGIKNGWVGGKMAAKFVKFMISAGIPWSSITANVLGPQKKAPHQLIQNLGEPAITAELLKLYGSNPSFKKSFDDEIARTTNIEWGALQLQNTLNAERLGPEEKPVTAAQLTPDPGGTPVMGIFRDEPEFRGASELLKRNQGGQVIFGHTHTEINGNDPKAKVRDYFNTGTWVDSLDLSQPAKRDILKNIKGQDLKNNTIFDLRLRQVIIDWDEATRVRLEPIEV